MNKGKAVKKPIPIDWFKFEIGNWREILEWIGSFGKDPEQAIEITGHDENQTFRILTLEGASYNLPDGYIVIRGIKGEFYPCDPEVFDESYAIMEE